MNASILALGWDLRGLSMISAKTWCRRKGRLKFQKWWFVRGGHQGISLSNLQQKHGLTDPCNTIWY